MVYSIKIPNEMRQNLFGYATKTGNSVASIIRTAVTEYLKKQND